MRQAAIAALEAAELLPAGQRVWLRPRQLPAGFELTVPEALECMRCAPGTLFAVHGVCIAASAVFQRPAACAFQCASCGKVGAGLELGCSSWAGCNVLLPTLSGRPATPSVHLLHVVPAPGQVCTLHSMDAPPPCCGGVPPQEVEQARVMVPVRGCT